MALGEVLSEAWNDSLEVDEVLDDEWSTGMKLKMDGSNCDGAKS